MKATIKPSIAAASWGITAVMMHPSFASLAAVAINAALLATLAYLPTKQV